MSKAIFISLVVVVISNVIYHVSQKSVSADANPLVSTAMSYVVGIIVCALLYPFFPQKSTSITELVKNLNWASYAVGIGAVGIEIGVLIGYRAGWDISAASITFNSIVALILIPIGLMLFGESFTVTKAIGIVLCLGGLILISQK